MCVYFRDDENKIEVHSYPSPVRDAAFASLNSNKRQAIESTDKDITTNLSTPELNAFGTRGPVRSCDDWACTRSEAQAKEHGAKPGANGHLSHGDIEYEHPIIGSVYRIPDDCEDGQPIGSPNSMPYVSFPCHLLILWFFGFQDCQCFLTSYVLTHHSGSQSLVSEIWVGIDLCILFPTCFVFGSDYQRLVGQLLIICIITMCAFQERGPLDLSHPSFQLRVPSADVDKV